MRVKRRIPRRAQPESSTPSFPYGRKDGAVTWEAGGALDPPRERVWVGVDSSVSNLAIVALDESGLYHWWIHSPKLAKNATTAQRLDRLDAHMLFLDQTVGLIKLRAGETAGVWMEGYGFGSQSAVTSAELGGPVKLALHRKLMTPVTPAPNQLKLYATGNGHAEKSDIKLAVFKSWGMEFTDDNLADAYVLARMARAADLGAETKARTSVLDKVLGR